MRVLTPATALGPSLLRRGHASLTTLAHNADMSGNTPTYTIALAERLGIGRIFRSGLDVGPDIQSRLYGQLLNSPGAVLMGAICSLIVLTTANFRSPSGIFAVFFALEVIIAVGRIVEWRRRRKKEEAGAIVDVSWSALLSIVWCGLQGAVAFTIMIGGDPVLQVLSTTLVMAAIGPICARNYASPKFATLLLILTDIPFVAGAVLSSEPLLSIILVLTPPFVFAAWQIIIIYADLKQKMRDADALLKCGAWGVVYGPRHRSTQCASSWAIIFSPSSRR